MEDIQKVDKYDLSFIIPCYNAEKYIARSIDSVVKHPHNSSKIEIIIVNDGSTDNSESIIDEYCNKYNYITKLNKKNGGCSSAINLGLQHFKGAYVNVFAADDWINIEVVLDCLQKARVQDLDLISFGLDFVNDNGTSTGSLINHTFESDKLVTGIKALTLGYVPSSICVFLMHKDFFQKKNIFFINNITHNDVEISIRLMLNSERVLFTKRTGYFYYNNLGSISKSKTKETLEKYLFDEVTISKLMKENIQKYKLTNKETVDAVKKNYNSVVWNLLWRFVIKPQEVDYDFKIKCLSALKDYDLYPVEGKLKTSFQKMSRLFFNSERFLKLLLKR